MLNSICIFTKGGLILFHHDEGDIGSQPLSELIQQVLIQERQGATSFKSDNYLLKWSLSNEYNFVVVGIALNIGRVNQQKIEEALASIQDTFIDQYHDDLKSQMYQDNYDEFLKYYEKIIDTVENTKTQRTENNRNKKEPRQTQEQLLAKALDNSDPPQSGSQSPRADQVKPQTFKKTDFEYDAVDIKLKRSQAAASSQGGMWSYFQGLVGQKELTKEDFDKVAKQFHQKLVEKNVSSAVATSLVDGVVAGLLGQKLGTFNTMYQTISDTLEESLTRMMAGSNSVDVLTGVAKAKAEGRPYSIVFCGVNGVGKSTSLSKIASYFLAQGLTVGVAACDTFRSGAIEQLKTHTTALGINLYDKGYGKDEASVAQDGIRCAKRDGLDVILIDTAGRMQGNDPLMKGLANLMNKNEPDLILFVGEALVGNDGCDQLINFNRALKENSGKANPRTIDGIVLTKFDTIDDKVGAAINMVWSTQKPIVFVGVGQTYKDLRKPNPAMFVDALLK